jgi:hypothetical protein
MENCAYLQQLLLLTREDGQSGGNRTTPKKSGLRNFSPNQIDPIKNQFSRRKSAKIYISQRHCPKNRPKIGAR